MLGVFFWFVLLFLIIIAVTFALFTSRRGLSMWDRVSDCVRGILLLGFVSLYSGLGTVGLYLTCIW